MAQTIPDGEVVCTDRLNRQALATIRHRRAPHLIPDELNVSRILSFDKQLQVFLEDVACGLVADTAADAGRAVGKLDLDHDCAERVDTPTGPLRFVLLIHR